MIDKCSSCGAFKSIDFDVCYKCYQQTAGAWAPKRPNVVQRDDREFSADSEADSFFVYVLLMDGGEYYIGQTREIHERLHEHRNDMSQSTRGRNPKLVWFTEVPTREKAADLEQHLQQLNSDNSNRRQITRMVVRFDRLVGEMK